MSSFTPNLAPPGVCTLTDPDLAWLHLLSDIGTGLAYFSIPAALVVFAIRRQDLAYPWVFGLFALFIIACGATHFAHAWAMFHPNPLAEGLIKAFCAAVSIATAITLWPLLPRLLALPSPAALAREVEERRAAERRALDSEARTAAFIDNLAEALFVLRVEGRGERFVTETVNPAYERLFGLPAAQVLGRDAQSGFLPGITERVLPNWQRAVATGTVQRYEVEAETPLGHRVWQTVLVPMRNAAGEVERLLGSARDITETRRLQAGLVESARLATIGTMCAGLAHETSQPLNAALLWLRHARNAATGLMTEQGARLIAAIGVVEGQLRRAGDLVGRIRGLASAEAGAAETFDATGVVGAAVRTADGQYAPDGIALSFTAPAGPLAVTGSPARLEQAVLHLLSNARDAVLEARSGGATGPARIAVALRQAGRQAVIEVRDSGPGVPEALRQSIFDPFFTTKEPGHGSGLGLSLAAAVARAMGGGIAASNLPEGGACFTMTLALSEPTADGLAPLAVAC
ncbi:sensor histidine kinase [Falsiroseomonas ponticola]|uniref:sensor histidine kinase n=1 Tax=Falsiroseomonas ponticola TaxID=2786951 RepID=UPI001931312E|nr:ATP-binding protein [Roseomonas ponticola]